MRKKHISLFVVKIFGFDDKSVTADRSCLTVGPDISVHPVWSALAGEVGGWRGGVDGVVNPGLS